MSPLTFTPAREQDAALLVQLYDAAFRADYERYGECPAYGRTVEQMQASIRRFPKLIIRRDGAPVGVLSAQQQDEGTYYIGCLSPRHSGKALAPPRYSGSASSIRIGSLSR